MRRALLSMPVFIILGANARGDLSPPAGYKVVPATLILFAEKPITDYRLFYKSGHPAIVHGPRTTAPPFWQPMDLSPDHSIEFPGATGWTRTVVHLIAIPKRIVEQYPDSKGHFEAINRNEVPGLLQTGLSCDISIPISDSRSEVHIRLRL